MLFLLSGNPFPNLSTHLPKHTHLLRDPLSPAVPQGHSLYLISLTISILELHTHSMSLSWPSAPSRCLARSRGFNKCLWDAWMEKWMDFMNPHAANLEFVIRWRQAIYWGKVWKKYSNLGFYCLCSSLLRNANLPFSPAPITFHVLYAE